MAKGGNNKNERQARLIAAALFGNNCFARKKSKQGLRLQPCDTGHPVTDVFHRNNTAGSSVIQINFKTLRARADYMQELYRNNIQCDSKLLGGSTAVATSANGQTFGLQVPCVNFLNDTHIRQQFIWATTKSPQGALAHYIARRRKEAGIILQNTRIRGSHKQTVFGAYTAREKIAAAEAFQKYLSGELSPAGLIPHNGALTQGRLWKQVVKPYLESQGAKNVKKNDITINPVQGLRDSMAKKQSSPAWRRSALPIHARPFEDGTFKPYSNAPDSPPQCYEDNGGAPIFFTVSSPRAKPFEDGTFKPLSNAPDSPPRVFGGDSSAPSQQNNISPEDSDCNEGSGLDGNGPVP